MNNRMDSFPGATTPVLERPGLTRRAALPAPVQASIPSYFQRACPTCGRRLRIDMRYLGQPVWCGHCRRRFVARESPGPAPDSHGSQENGGDALLDRAERLLALCARSRVARRPSREKATAAQCG